MKGSSILESAAQYFYVVRPVSLSIIVFTLLSGCTVYEPVPAYVPAPARSIAPGARRSARRRMRVSESIPKTESEE